MKILAIDSSAVAASAALVEDGKIRGEFFLNVGLTHSQTLMPLISSVLECAGTAVRDIDFLAVTNGPGSFTGVRIGTATVKGIAAAGAQKCIGVSTLKALAYNLYGRECIICAAMDARCGQVYAALFSSTRHGITRLTDDDALSIEALGEKLKQYDGQIVFVGDGAVLCMDKLSQTLENAAVAAENVRFQRAGGVAAAVMHEKLYDSAVDGEQLEVTYLRLSQAERELKMKNDK